MAMHTTYVCDVCGVRVNTREGIYPRKWWRVVAPGPTAVSDGYEANVCSVECAHRMIDKFVASGVECDRLAANTNGVVVPLAGARRAADKP